MRLLIASLAAVSFAFLPAVARADSPDVRSFSDVCVPAPLQTCADFRFVTTQGARGTTFTLYFRNLQGTSPHDQSVASTFGGMHWVERQQGIWGLDDFAVTQGTQGNVLRVGTPGAYDFTQDPARPGAHTGEVIFSPFGGFNGAPIDIAGCNGLSGSTVDPISTGYFETCPAQGADGWYWLAMQTSGHFSVDDVLVTFALGGIGADGSFAGGRCTIGVDCLQFASPPVTSTPEPNTIALLGSGLAGMGGAGRLRRRARA